MLRPTQVEVLQELGTLTRAIGALRVPALAIEAWRKLAKQTRPRREAN